MNGRTLFAMSIIYALFGFSEVLMSKYLLADWGDHSIVGSIHQCVAVWPGAAFALLN
jgi:hypothetical protein